MEFNFEVNNEKELDLISKEIFEKFKSKVFLFYGEMGVGKTTFIKSICNHITNFISPKYCVNSRQEKDYNYSGNIKSRGGLE